MFSVTLETNQIEEYDPNSALIPSDISDFFVTNQDIFQFKHTSRNHYFPSPSFLFDSFVTSLFCEFGDDGFYSHRGRSEAF
jgi:hypothetical protein